MRKQLAVGDSTPALAPLVRGNILPLSEVRPHLNAGDLLRCWAAGKDYTSFLRAGKLPFGISLNKVSVTVVAHGKIYVAAVEESCASTCDEGCSLQRVLPQQCLRLLDEGAIPVFVGIDRQGRVHMGLLCVHDTQGATADALIKGSKVESLLLRDCAHELADDDVHVALTLTALFHWHRSTRYCSWCAGEYRPVHGGWVRQCERCEQLEYPRQDPAMIVAVTNDHDEILLAHNALWAEKKVSVLAGFIDSGEAPHRSVERELWEEVGVKVQDIRFIGSQPWPFPRSLMLAYEARVEGSDVLQPDGEEIQWAKWYSKDALDEAARSEEIILPGVNTIAYGMISRWYGGALPHGDGK